MPMSISDMQEAAIPAKMFSLRFTILTDKFLWDGLTAKSAFLPTARTSKLTAGKKNSRVFQYMFRRTRL